MHHRQHPAPVPFAFFVTVALAAAPATAQCGLQFHPGMGIPGVLGDVFAMTTWDRDGAGPLPPLLVIAGDFLEAGTLRTSNIAAYDPASGNWSALGNGANSNVNALAVAPNGDLIAGGRFTVAGSVVASRVARWDGTAWSPLGTGINGPVSALAVMPNGDVVAGGNFTTAGGSPANNIAQWNGVAWSPLGAGTGGFIQASVAALAVLPSGDVIAGGSFTTAGALSAPCVARWNGSSWSPMITTITNGSTPIVQAFAQMPNGDLVAAGSFTSIDTVASSNIARWNGTSWAPLGAGTDGSIHALALRPNGNLVAGGSFSNAGGGLASRIANWDGTAWSPFSSGANDAVSAIALLATGEIVAGGLFSEIGNAPAAAVGIWNGGWATLVSGAGPGAFGGVDAPVNVTMAMPNGDLVAAGWFTKIGGVAARRIARWNGTTWAPLGAGIDGPVYALAAMPNGDIVAGGGFENAGGTSALRVARWNGTTWAPLGGGPGIIVSQLAALANGDVVAANGSIFAGHMLARWNGTSWLPMAATSIGGVNSLAVFQNGDLLIAGGFTSVDGVPANSLARWNGTTWSPIGGGSGGAVIAATVMPDGGVVVAGMFNIAGGIPANGIARWNGLAWSPLGSGLAGPLLGMPMTVLPLPGGDVLFGGSFAMVGGVPVNRLARWNGAVWTAFGPGCDDTVHGLSALPNGDVVVNGAFLTAGGMTSARIARVSSTCPATVVGLGAGCTGSGGPNVLTATTLPWTGGTFRATATGMPALALVLSVYGFTPVSIPMAAVLPQGLPGCDIHMLADFIDVLLPAAGAVHTQLAVPDTQALAGLVLHHYVVPFEVDPALQILAITSSNALTLTIGSF